MSLRSKKLFRPKVPSSNLSEKSKLSISINSVDSSSSSIQMKGQGDDVRINIDELDNTIKYLRQYHNILIKDLKGDALEKLKYLIQQVLILYETQNHSILCQLIKKYFGGLEKIKPGTVAAYCYGCLTETTMSDLNPECSPICSGSIPSEEGTNTCENTVLVASYDGKNYNIRINNRGSTEEGRETAYMFIDCLTMKMFHGFTDDEKRELKSWGLRNLILYGYKDNGKEYIKLVEKQPIDKFKSRVSYKYSSNHSESKSHQKGVIDTSSIPFTYGFGFEKIGIILILLIIIFIIIGFLSQVRRYH